MRTTTSPTRSSRPSRLPSLKVLGIDPGLAATGYAVITPSPGRAVVVDSGVIGTASDLPLEARLSTIYDVVDRLLVSHAPSVLVLEDVYTACRFPRAALLMAHARGVVCLAARQHEVTVLTLSPAEVKRAVSANGAASKGRSEEHTSELQSRLHLVCRLLLE